MKESLVFPLADALSLQMHDMGSNVIRGAGSRSLSSGPFRFDAEMVVMSDEFGDTRASFLIRLHSTIWLYAIVDEKSVNAYDLTFVSFDGLVMGLKAKDVSTFGTGKASDTLKKIGVAARKAYKFAANGKRWEEIDLESVQ